MRAFVFAVPKKVGAGGTADVQPLQSLAISGSTSVFGHEET